MKLLAKINFLHLLLTIVVTTICVVPTFIIFILLDGFLLDNLSLNTWNYELKILILEFLPYIIFFAILIVKWSKAKRDRPREAFSFLATSILLTFVFCWFARYKIENMLDINPSGKNALEKAEEDRLTIEKFIKENQATDSLSSKQIDKLVDTLGEGWKRVDTLK